MSEHVLNYLINLMGGLLLPSFLFILSSWRVAKLRNLNAENFQDRVDESVANTIKEQLGEKILNPLFRDNNVMLPPGNRAYDVIDTLVPGNDVEFISSIYTSLAQLGVSSPFYGQLLHIVNTLWGGG